MWRILKTLFVATFAFISLCLLRILIPIFKTEIVPSAFNFMTSQDHDVEANVNLTATSLPVDNPVSVQFSAWLDAFNSHDRKLLLAYHTAHFPYAVASHDVSDIGREMLLSDGTGGFEFVECLQASEVDLERMNSSTIEVLLREKKRRMYARAMMRVDLLKDDHPVTAFEINPTHPPIRFAPPDREQEFRKALGPLTPTRRKCVISAISDALQTRYIFPEGAAKMIRDLKAKMEDSGDYDTYDESQAFARRVTRDMQAVSGDKHIRVHFGEPPKHPDGEDEERKPRKLFDVLRAVDFGFSNRSIETIKNKKLGFLPIGGFVPSRSESASDSAAIQEAISDIVSEISDTDALIIDLRDNGGGDPNTVAFILSYFLDGAPVRLNDFVDRNGAVTMSCSTMTESKLPKNAMRFGGSKPLFVLTSKRTVSGGEEMAYDLQALKRARCIIGTDETTAGAAHPVMGPTFLCEEDFGKGWWAFGVPSLQPVNAVTGSNWEGVGVRSDVVVGKGEDAKEVGRRMAMKALGLYRSMDDWDETPTDL